MSRRLGAAVVATVGSGIAYALAFPPLRLRPLAWIALVPFFLALRSARDDRGAVHAGGAVHDSGAVQWPRRLALGILWTLVSGWSVGTWMPGAVSSYFDQPLVIGIALFLLVTGLMAAPYYAAFAVAYAPLTRYGAATPFLAGAAWAAVELARGRLFNGTLAYVGNSPWATFGYSQVGYTPLVQIAAVTGVYGVSFLLASVNAALAEVLAAWLDRRPVTRGAWLGLASTAAVVALVVVWGALVVRAGTPTAGPAVPIAIVQGNLGATVRWSAEGPARTLETYQRLTREALATSHPRVVFWPEAALTSFIEQEAVHRRALGVMLTEHDSELVVGAPRAGAPNGAAPYTNSVYLVAPDGTLAARYDKQWLLPFMEYFPLRLEMARRHFGRVREFSPGAATPPLATRAGAAGVLICNEAFLPPVASERIAAGATYLVNPSNDSWVPDAGFAWQQFDIASLRAVEQRRYLLRVSDSGPSGVVDPWGRVVAHTEALTRATLQAEVTPIATVSPYARVGDLFGIVCGLATLVGVLASTGATHRQRNGAPARHE